MAEQIREILVQEQDHQIDLATALVKKFERQRRHDVLYASVVGSTYHSRVVARFTRLRISN